MLNETFCGTFKRKQVFYLLRTWRKQKTAEQIRHEKIEKLQSFRLFDDTYMTRFFDENIPCTEFVLRILMNTVPDTIPV